MSEGGRVLAIVEDHRCPRPEDVPEWTVWQCQCGDVWRYEPGLGGCIWFRWPRKVEA